MCNCLKLNLGSFCHLMMNNGLVRTRTANTPWRRPARRVRWAADLMLTVLTPTPLREVAFDGGRNLSTSPGDPQGDVHATIPVASGQFRNSDGVVASPRLVTQ